VHSLEEIICTYQKCTLKQQSKLQYEIHNVRSHYNTSGSWKSLQNITKDYKTVRYITATNSVTFTKILHILCNRLFHRLYTLSINKPVIATYITLACAFCGI
jgi:hypothetical protein